jgi:cysteine desulfurase
MDVYDQLLKFIARSADAAIQRRQDMTQREKNASTVITVAAAAGVYLLWRKRKELEEYRKQPAPSECIYLDYNGTTPIYPKVLESMIPYLKQHYGNPSSSHILGKEPRRAIDHARRQILGFMGAYSADVDLSSLWFTGCGTESDNLAIQLAVQSSQHIAKKHIVTCNVEHQAIELYLKNLEALGEIEVTYVPVDKEGRVSAKDMIDAIQANTVLVTLMLANNESGTLQPVQEVAQACRERGVLMHTDAAQAAGKVSIAMADLGYPEMVSVVGHKIGAAKGIAALYVRNGCCSENGRKLHAHGVLLIGGGQEFGRRGGTENTAGIVGFGTAAELAGRSLQSNAQHMEQMRNRLLANLQAHLGEVNVRPNGPFNPSLRLPNTLSVGFRLIHSGDLLADIGHQVAASAGATCHSAGSVSSVLRAMQVPDEFARGTLRLSLGPTTRATDVDRAAAIIAEGVKKQLDSRKTAMSQ